MKTLLEPLTTAGEEGDSAAPANSAHADRSSGPVFVVGMWRSGTSLFYALLNQHPEIALMYEGDLLLLRPVFWLPGAGSRWAARWQFWNQALTRHKIEMDRLAPSSSSFRHSLEAAYREPALRKGASIWGEKSPNYYDSLTRLARDFPDARFIVIWRDPAAICRSVIRAAEDPASWFRRKGMIIRTLLGYRVLKTQCDRLAGRGVQLLQVQYETLVKDPTATMMEVCAFLGVPFVPAMTSLEAADRSAIYQGEHHSLVKGEDIISARARPRGETLPPGVKSKIERYVALWRAETRGTWPQCTGTENSEAIKPAWLERVVDGCAYRYFRTLDFVVSIVYSLAPVSVLKAWRERAHGARTEEEK
ncbi:MAG: sulfotransferase family protein [Terriglobales bacterium]